MKFCKSVENTVEKGEIAHYEQTRACLGKVKGTSSDTLYLTPFPNKP